MADGLSPWPYQVVKLGLTPISYPQTCSGMPRLNFVDLFCGAGGWTEGLKRAGLRHVVGVDADAAALATYVANHKHGMLADVRDVTLKSLAPHLTNLPGSGSVDLVVASPPCQSLSTIGPRRPDDPADMLFTHAVRIAKALNAPFFVMENVPGLMIKTGGKLVVSLVECLKSNGYAHVEMRLLNASDYQVPQSRKRVVVVASTRLLAAPCFPAPVRGFDATLRKLLVRPESVPAFYWMTPEKAEYYRARARTTGYVLFVDPDRIARTVRAGYAKSRGAEALVVHGRRMRMLTELECARIQSFPDSYVFVGPITSRYRQIGNAVPPMLAFHVGRAVAKCMKLTLHSPR